MSEIDDFGRDYYTVYNKTNGKIDHSGFLTGPRPWKTLEENQDITFKKSKTDKHKVKIDGIDLDGKRKTIIIDK